MNKDTIHAARHRVSIVAQVHISSSVSIRMEDEKMFLQLDDPHEDATWREEITRDNPFYSFFFILFGSTEESQESEPEPFPEDVLHFETDLETTIEAIQGCPVTGDLRAWYLIKHLKEMFTSMAALDGFATHDSCFSSETTDIVRRLVEAIEGER